ncbi:MAG TPA: radical SAM protein [Thermotogota bacterium]|nr:radical SAM protein [Thermotogota bacterium]
MEVEQSVLPESGNYVELYKTGELQAILEEILPNLEHCQLCPRKCGINRSKERGVCQQSDQPMLTNVVVHTGEEPPLIEGTGAGAVFFSGCPMKCVYCQNFAFSQLNNGEVYTSEQLADAFLRLQDKGVCNIDLVTPTPHLVSIIRALIIAVPKGLHLPIVYNTSSYENVDILRKIEGVVDVYLADIRYTDDTLGLKYSGVQGYWTHTKRAIREMFRQVGARRLIIRHLVLPNGLSGTEEAMAFVAEELSTNVNVSLMSQYFPVFKALGKEELSRKITAGEYDEAVKIMEAYGLFNGWVQDF